MKIYPSKHIITTTDKVDLKNDIPLAYIDAEDEEYAVSIYPSLPDSGISPIIPYQEFGTYEIALFRPKNKFNLNDIDNFEKVTDEDLLQRIGDIKQYIPKGTTSFSPQEFTYQLLVKKKILYKSTRTYNIKVSCLDDDTKDETDYLSKKLLKVFGDASIRGLCPPNVAINNKDLSQSSLAKNSIDDNDIIFIDSKDGKTMRMYSESKKEVVNSDIDFNYFLDRNINLWISVGNLTELTDMDIEITSRNIYSSLTINSKGFDYNSLQMDIPNVKSTFVDHNIFKDGKTFCIIREYENLGFIVFSTRDFFNSLESNSKALYEIMFYIYANTYSKSQETTSWITDTVPDYIVSHNKLTTIDKFVSIKPLHRFFALNEDEVVYKKAFISEPNIEVSGIYDNYAVFEKKYTGEYSSYADPIKSSEDMISIYTQQHEILYFNDFLYTVQDDVSDKLSFSIHNNSMRVTLRNFKSSIGNIDISDSPIVYVDIPLYLYNKKITNETYCLYITGGISLNYCKKSDYIEDVNKIVIAEVNIHTENAKQEVYDMRQRGGGLPKSYGDVSDELLDIGYIKGLAYRKAGTIIITLPTRFKPYKYILENALKKHIVAEKLLILLFEDATT